MSTQKPRITIVGIGLIGGSLGLALRQAEVASAVVGHDKEPGVNNQAKKAGAVDRTEWNLISACEKSDLVILATPASEMQRTMEAIGPFLRPGCVVMDTASVKLPVLAWADEFLPEQVHFVGSDPILGAEASAQGGLEAARADLFQGGVFCLTPSPSADPAAVKLVSDLTGILGATPIFFDPAEHDGLVAAVDHLPTFLSLTLLNNLVHQPAWRELRKVAGAPFEAVTQLAGTEPTALVELFLSNKDNIVRAIDGFSASLAALRQDLAEGETEELAQRFGEATEAWLKWHHDRETGQWEGDVSVQMPEKPNVLADAFLGGWWRKRRKSDE